MRVKFLLPIFLVISFFAPGPATSGSTEKDFGSKYEMVEEAFYCYSKRITYASEPNKMTMLQRAGTYEQMRNKGYSEEQIRTHLKQFGLTSSDPIYADLPNQTPEILMEFHRAGTLDSAIWNTRPQVEGAISDLWDSVMVDKEDYHERIWVERSSIRPTLDPAAQLSNFLIENILFCGKLYFDTRS